MAVLGPEGVVPTAAADRAREAWGEEIEDDPGVIGPRANLREVDHDAIGVVAERSDDRGEARQSRTGCAGELFLGALQDGGRTREVEQTCDLRGERPRFAPVERAPLLAGSPGQQRGNEGRGAEGSPRRARPQSVARAQREANRLRVGADAT